MRSCARGNRIGTNAVSSAAVPNNSDGIEIQAAFDGGDGNGTSFGNLISGNGGVLVADGDVQIGRTERYLPTKFTGLATKLK